MSFIHNIDNSGGKKWNYLFAHLTLNPLRLNVITFLQMELYLLQCNQSQNNDPLSPNGSKCNYIEM